MSEHIIVLKKVGRDTIPSFGQRWKHMQYI